MQKRNVANQMLAVLGATAVMGLCACATDEISQERFVRGKVTFAQAVVGASVHFETVDGHALAVSPIETDAVGMFEVQVPADPAEIVVVTSGGSIGNQPFTGSLRARIEQGSRAVDPVNFLTTLADRLAYDDQTGGLRRAVERLSDYFFVPGWTTFDFLSLHGDRYRNIIDNRIFVERATALGFDTYIEALLGDIRSGRRAGNPDLYSLTADQVTSGLAAVPGTGDAATAGAAATIAGLAGAISPYIGPLSYLGKGLLSGLNFNLADKFYNGNHSGWVLRMLMTGGDLTGPKLDYIVNKVDVIDDELTSLVNSFNTFASDVEDKLSNLQTQLSILESDITSLIATFQLDAYLTYIQSNVHYDLGVYGLIPMDATTHTIVFPSDTTRASILFWANTMLGKNDTQGNGGIKFQMLAIHNGLTGALQTHISLLEALVNTYLARLGTGTTHAQTLAAYQHFEAQFLNYVYFELAGFNIYAEAAHATGFLPNGTPDPTAVASLQQVQTDFQRNLATQADLFLRLTRRLVVNSNQDTLDNELATGATRPILTRAYAVASLLGATSLGSNNLFVVQDAPNTGEVIVPSLSHGGSLLVATTTTTEDDTGLRYLLWSAATTDGSGHIQQGVALSNSHHLALYGYQTAEDDAPVTVGSSTVGATWYDVVGVSFATYRDAKQVRAESLEPGPHGLLDVFTQGNVTTLLEHGVAGGGLYADQVSGQVRLLEPAHVDATRDCVVEVQVTRKGDNPGDPDQVLLAATCQNAAPIPVVAKADGSIVTAAGGTGTSFEILYVDPNSSPPTATLHARLADAQGNPTDYCVQPRGYLFQRLWTRDRVSEQGGFRSPIAGANTGTALQDTSGLDANSPSHAAVSMTPSGTITATVQGASWCEPRYLWWMKGTAAGNLFWNITNNGTQSFSVIIDSRFILGHQLGTLGYSFAQWAATFADTAATGSIVSFRVGTDDTSPPFPIQHNDVMSVNNYSWAPQVTLAPGKNYQLVLAARASLGLNSNGDKVEGVAMKCGKPKVYAATAQAAVTGITWKLVQ